VNSLPKTVTRQRCDCDLNAVLSAPESSTLTARLPSHLVTVGRLIRRSGPIFRPPCDSPRQALGAVPTSRPRQTPSPTPSSRQSRPLELGASSAAESGHQPPDDSTTPTVHRPVAAARPRPRWPSVVPSWRRLRRSVAACRRPPLAAKPRRIGRRPARRCRRPVTQRATLWV